MSETEARKAIDAYFTAWNARDGEALQKILHYPHVRVNGRGRVIVTEDIQNAEEHFKGVFDYLSEREGWNHSTLDMVEVIHASDVKVHFKIEFNRYKADGTKYATYQSLWIVTKEDGHWGILARSSYAP